MLIILIIIPTCYDVPRQRVTCDLCLYTAMPTCIYLDRTAPPMRWLKTYSQHTNPSKSHEVLFKKIHPPRTLILTCVLLRLDSRTYHLRLLVFVQYTREEQKPVAKIVSARERIALRCVDELVLLTFDQCFVLVCFFFFAVGFIVFPVRGLDWFGFNLGVRINYEFIVECFLIYTDAVADYYAYQADDNILW